VILPTLPNDPKKLFLEMKKNANKAFLGEAKIKGELIEIESATKKVGVIKPHDVKKGRANTSLNKYKLTWKNESK
jgi:hypothetical protein